jgi:hypothetical protein
LALRFFIHNFVISTAGVTNLVSLGHISLGF